MKYKAEGKVWLYPSENAAWHFVSLPKKLALTLRKKYKDLHKGWSSLPIKVTLGKSMWKTSVFYDKRSETYLLPIKSQIRKKESILAQDKIKFSIEITI